MNLRDMNNEQLSEYVDSQVIPLMVNGGKLNATMARLVFNDWLDSAFADQKISLDQVENYHYTGKYTTTDACDYYNNMAALIIEGWKADNYES